MLLSIIVPVYNEERTIRQVINDLIALNMDKEIIVVNDGSTDKTPHIIKELATNIKTVDLPNNYGKGYAVREGLKIATGEYTVIVDADNEYKIQDIYELVTHVKHDEVDAVYGLRRYKDFRFNILGLIGTRLLFRLFYKVFYKEKIPDALTCYKLINSNIFKGLNLNARGFDVDIEITSNLLNMGYSIRFIPVAYEPRTVKQGKKLRLFRDGVQAVKTAIKLL